MTDPKKLIADLNELDLELTWTQGKIGETIKKLYLAEAEITAIQANTRSLRQKIARIACAAEDLDGWTDEDDEEDTVLTDDLGLCSTAGDEK